MARQHRAMGGSRQGIIWRAPAVAIMFALILAGLGAAQPSGAVAHHLTRSLAGYQTTRPTPTCPPNAQLRASGPYVPAAQFAHIIHVPGDQPTIQAAVDAAQPGDLVLVAAGVYHENVIVCTANLTVRGADRNGTVLDGSDLAKTSNGFTVLADNVILENMTAHHFGGNGFFWTGQTGYRGSYLTAYDNGDYGIYAFGSRLGEFDHDYASGSPDSGFYIGQCFPCDAIITNVLSERNGLGYSGTNAGGNLTIKNSEWDHNGAGIVPNTLDSEKMAPQRGASIVNNYVHDNGDPNTPYNKSTHPGLGAGIAIPGGDFDYVARNHVTNNSAYGILVLGNVDDNLWLASGNVVVDNRVSGSGIADLALGGPSGANNCFANNRAGTTLPILLEVTHPCGTPLPLNGSGDLGVTMHMLVQYINTLGPGFQSPDFRTFPAPKPQPSMPDVTAPPAPLFTEPFTPNDTAHGALPPAVPTGGPAMIAPLGFTAYSLVQILLSLYGNLVLFALYSAWLAVAFVELVQRTDLSTSRRIGWGALMVGIPLIGPIAYYFAGGSKLSRGLRLALVVGAPVLCLLVTALLMVVAYFTL